jgi:peptidoglycan hydrolase-like protein with peptidoglycan-binding domain
MCTARVPACTLNGDRSVIGERGNPMSDRRGPAIVVMLALVLAACGSSGDDTTTTTSTTFPTETTATTTTLATPTTATTSSTTTTTSPYGGATLLTTVIQQELTALGYFEGAADGILGPMTVEAISAFQTDAGITVDGAYGPETYEALADAMEADPDIVEAIQEDLMELRLYPGPADGDYGAGTLRAVEGLQAKCEIEVDGRFTPYTHVCLEQEMGRA